MMIDHITLGDVSVAISFVVARIGGIGFLNKNLKKWITSVMDESMKRIDGEIKEISQRLEKVDMESCKNFLVRCLADFERDNSISETELERFWEQYEHYKQAGGNSYIYQRVEKLKAQGKL